MSMKKTKVMSRIMAVAIAVAMIVSLLPASKIEASAASAKVKQYKTISCQLTGREKKIVTFASDIKSITYGSQSSISMKKISARKVEVRGKKNGTTRFYVVTKDKRHITCNVTRNNSLIMKPNSTRVIKTTSKVKSVKSLDSSVATATLSSGKVSYTVKTKGKKATARLLVTYADNAKATITLKTNHAHRWVKKAYSEKVKTKDAWDEQVLDGYRDIQNETGEDVTDVDPYEWCKDHDCRDHFLGNGPCVSDCTATPVYKTVHHDATYENRTTPAKTHYECKYCGAVK